VAKAHWPEMMFNQAATVSINGVNQQVEAPRGFEAVPTYCVVPERDPVDSYISLLRCNFTGSEKDFLKMINGEVTPETQAANDKAQRWLNTLMNQLNYVEWLKQNYVGKLLVLDYEKFFFSYSYIYNEFEKFFNIEIPVETRIFLEHETNRDTNTKIQKTLKDFSEEDEDSLIHGNHIWKGYPGFAKDLLQSSHYDHLKNIFAGVSAGNGGSFRSKLQKNYKDALERGDDLLQI
tara:strand:- start:1224 stop:1925 length:702 start_codon:yes stop_codon:yes gene_type:complete